MIVHNKMLRNATTRLDELEPGTAFVFDAFWPAKYTFFVGQYEHLRCLPGTVPIVRIQDGLIDYRSGSTPVVSVRAEVTVLERI